MPNLKKFQVLIYLFFAQQNIAQQVFDKQAVISGIEKRIALPVIPAYKVLVTQFDAKGDSVTNCKPAFDKAMRACQKHNGGTIVIPKGIYTLNGPIHFVSNVNLHFEKGAKIRFGSNPKSYLPMVLTSWEGTTLYNYSPLIYAYNVHDIAITGEGIIDGEASKTWIQWKAKEGKDQILSREMNHTNLPIEKRLFGESHFLRPQLIQFFNSKNILVEDVKIEDSPFWCIHLLKSKSITLRNLKYDAQNNNNDGIDPECSSDILIENCQFNNGDDNIAIKAGRDDEGRSASSSPSENIIIRNCSFKGLHALVIGSEMSAGVRNVFMDNCAASGYLKRGIYFKTNSDRGGFIKDIYISNVDFGKVEDCIYMTANYHGEGSGLFPSKISNIKISNIRCLEASNTALVLEGYPKSKIEDVVLENITIKSAKNGMTLTNTKNITFDEVTIGEKSGVPSSIK